MEFFQRPYKRELKESVKKKHKVISNISGKKICELCLYEKFWLYFAYFSSLCKVLASQWSEIISLGSFLLHLRFHKILFANFAWDIIISKLSCQNAVWYVKWEFSVRKDLTPLWKKGLYYTSVLSWLRSVPWGWKLDPFVYKLF